MDSDPASSAHTDVARLPIVCERDTRECLVVCRRCCKLALETETCILIDIDPFLRGFCFKKSLLFKKKDEPGSCSRSVKREK